MRQDVKGQRARKPVKYYSAKRRHAMSLGENIVHLEIFERDNWTCWICNSKIDKRLRQPSWWCATLDHVKPLCAFTDLSQWHRKDNVRAAHAWCNFSKSDSIVDNL